jgi:serine protease Do
LDLDQQLAPAGSGGLLATLHLWRRMLLMGPQEFGETYYLGTAPLMDHAGLFDYLVATHNVVETHFAFDPQTGYLTAVEMFPEMNVDPCEVHLSDYRPVGSLQLPHRMIVRQGNERFAELIVDQYLVP